MNHFYWEQNTENRKRNICSTRGYRFEGFTPKATSQDKIPQKKKEIGRPQKYFIVCFNKFEHFIRVPACNYVRNVLHSGNITPTTANTRAQKLICSYHLPRNLVRPYHGCNFNYHSCHQMSHQVQNSKEYHLLDSQ